jgi:hypothetical protein
MQRFLKTRLAVAALALVSVTAVASDKYECRTVGNMSIVFVPGTTEAQKQEAIKQAMPYAFDETDYQVGGRWSSTSYGSTGSSGNPMTLGFSYVPDGTFVPSSGYGSGGSSLFNRMNALFGGNLWQTKIAQAFQQWDNLTGANYVLTNDDGAALHSSPGQQNVRGDVRISMITLSNGNVLAYNFFPNSGGDMVMNRSYNWNSAGADYRFMRNVITHEHGHGMGINHVMPVNETKLLEPFLSTLFDGPQSDDIQAGQWLYGDWLENNDNNGTKSDLGEVTNGHLVNNLAIERSSDTDWFKVLIPAGNNLTITVTPVGSTYLQGPQGGGSPTTRNSLTIHDLRATAYQSDGTTVIQVQNAAGLGLPEVISNIVRPANGEITLKVDSVTGSSDIQRYRINFNLVPASILVQTGAYTLIRGSSVSGNLASLLASDNDRLVLGPGVVFSTSQAPIEFIVEGTSSELDPTHLRMKLEALASAAAIQRSVELFNFDTNAYEQVASAAVGTTEAIVSIDVASNPGRFVAPGGTIRARVRSWAGGPVFANPWSLSTDHIFWELTP